METNKYTEAKTVDSISDGYGSGARELNTPEVMRDCIREHYWERPSITNVFQVVGGLADDFKRRGFTYPKASEIIHGHLIETLGPLKPDALKQIKTKLDWVYKKQTQGLTCTGTLNRYGICHKDKKRCRFQEQDIEVRQWIRSTHPIVLTEDVTRFLGPLHPTDALYAGWTYLELFRLEHERNLIPGNQKEPIFIGFRALASRVIAQNGRAGYDRHCACKYIRLLEDAGFIKTVVKGKAGKMQRKANGYIRLTPISPKYNSESQTGAHICVQEIIVPPMGNQGGYK